MDENWAETLSGFNAVWERVQGHQPPEEAPRGAPGMAELIRGEAEGAQYYAALARLCAGRSADAFAAMAAECCRSRKRMETEFFLETGDTCLTEPEPLPCDGALGYLRRAYLREGRAAQEYLRASASAEGEALRLLYGELSRLCTRRREKLFGLAELMLG